VLTAALQRENKTQTVVDLLEECASNAAGRLGEKISVDGAVRKGGGRKIPSFVCVCALNNEARRHSLLDRVTIRRRCADE